MASTETYNPSQAFNPAAGHRAVWYVSQYGTAAAALRAVESPGYDDAFDRAVCDELRTIRHIEWTAAKDAYPFVAQVAPEYFPIEDDDDQPSPAGIYVTQAKAVAA